jgi:hypothetical protein
VIFLAYYKIKDILKYPIDTNSLIKLTKTALHYTLTIFVFNDLLDTINKIENSNNLKKLNVLEILKKRTEENNFWVETAT